MTPLRTRATRWLTTGWVLALSGCFVLLPPPPDDKIVECEDSADCPAGYKCVQVGAVDGLDLEKVCIQSDTEDTKPPQVDLEELDPAFAGEGAVVSIGLYVQDEVELYTEPLLEVCPPDVPGEPNDCLAPTLVEVTPLDPDAAAEGQVGRSYYYELTCRGCEKAPGPLRPSPPTTTATPLVSSWWAPSRWMSPRRWSSAWRPSIRHRPGPTSR
jgi:hypothetical protein